jgi:hypothetical protein
MHNILNDTFLVAIAVAVIIVLFLGSAIALRRRPKQLDVKRFKLRWQEIEKLCGRNDTWPLAIINADTLLDEALKRRRFRGKTMGERLVAAQRNLKNNESVWFGHKLRNKIVHEEMSRLYRRDVNTALHGFRDALKDLGAL